MRSQAKRWLAAAVITVLTAGGLASAQNKPLIAAGELQKILKYVDTIGSKKSFAPPTAQNLGFSSDPNQTLPVTVIMTDDHRVYFCRSELNPDDYVLWVRLPGNDSYMFATHPNFELVRALYMPTENFPKVMDVKSAKVLDLYKRGLAWLVQDINKSPPPPTQK